MKINAAGKQIFLDVYNTPSSTLPATEIPVEILKRFEAAGMPLELEKGVTQEAFAKAVQAAFASMGLEYRNRKKAAVVIPEITFEFDEVEDAQALKTYTLNEIKDEMIGELGTEARDSYEEELATEIREDLGYTQVESNVDDLEEESFNLPDMPISEFTNN